MKTFGSFLLLTALLLAASPSYATDLTLFGGFQHQGKLTVLSATQGAGTFRFDPKNFGVFGIRTSHGRRIISFEHTFAYSPNFVESETRAFILNTNLLLEAPLAVVRPYATAGVGTVYMAGDGPASFGGKFAINYGGGLKVRAAGPVGGRFDVRGYALPSVQSQSLSVLEVTVGVVFSF